MATTGIVYGALQTLTVTNLQSKTSSVTGGWQSDAVDNTTDLWDDAQVFVEIAAVNTAPGGHKRIYVCAYGSVDTLYTSTGDGVPSGIEGNITFPDVTTLEWGVPIIGTIPYPVLNKALSGGPFGVARGFGGLLPRKWGVLILPYAGFTLAAAGNAVKWRGIRYSVA